MTKRINLAVAAFLAVVWISGPLTAQMAVQSDGAAPRIERLFADLAAADPAQARYLEAEIRQIWRKSGSPAMDLLLSRADQALRAGDAETALGHATALSDHAPGFAQGHVVRAMALYDLGRVGPAVAALERALALEPRHFDALAGFGVILAETGEGDRAREVFEAAQQLHPHLAEVDAALARLAAETRGTAL